MLRPSLVKLPDHDLVTVPQVIEHLVQFGSLGPRAAHAMIRNDLLAACRLQSGVLQVRVLVQRADPAYPMLAATEPARRIKGHISFSREYQK